MFVHGGGIENFLSCPLKSPAFPNMSSQGTLNPQIDRGGLWDKGEKLVITLFLYKLSFLNKQKNLGYNPMILPT